MSTNSSSSFSPVSLPMRRSSPFDPPAEYRRLREEEPISRLAFPDGKIGWLLTRHQDVRALLADDRFSSDRRRASSPVRRFPIRRDEPAVRAGTFTIGLRWLVPDSVIVLRASSARLLADWRIRCLVRRGVLP